MLLFVGRNRSMLYAHAALQGGVYIFLLLLACAYNLLRLEWTPISVVVKRPPASSLRPTPQKCGGVAAGLGGVGGVEVGASLIFDLTLWIDVNTRPKPSRFARDKTNLCPKSRVINAFQRRSIKMKIRRKDDSEQGWHWDVISTPPKDANALWRKKTTARLTPEERDHIDSTRINGRFAPGVSGFPGGSVRKAREDRYFIDALKHVFEGLGGVDHMLEWATTHETKFYEICSKLMPVQLQVEREYGNNTITVKHAFLPRQLSGPNQGQPMEGIEITMIDEANLSIADIFKAIKRMEASDKQSLLVALQASAGDV